MPTARLRPADRAPAPPPGTPGFRADPYPYYREIRERDPVHACEMAGRRATLLCRYDDVVMAMRDPRFSAERVKSVRGSGVTLAQRKRMHPLTRIHLGVLAFRDPPDHTRLRSLVSKAFSPRLVQQLRPRCQELLTELVDRMALHPSPDLVRDVAIPFPLMLIVELIGVPEKDRDRFLEWTEGVAALLDPTCRLERWANVRRSTQEIADYLGVLIAERRRRPGADLLTRLTQAQERGDALHDEEIQGLVIFLLSAGHETTRNLLGNGMLALLTHPAQRRLLERDPGLLSGAIEEFLRYDCPVQMTKRRALEDIELRGRTIPRGTDVYPLFGSANRDPERFADPDRLDLRRRHNRHVALGSGIHFCLGAALGRMEAEVCFDTLLRRFPRMALAVDPGELRWMEDVVLRGLESLPVTLD